MQVGTLTFEGTIQPWGNSLGLRITRPVSQLTNLQKGSKVLLAITEEGLLVCNKPDIPHKFTEAQLIEHLTPTLAHADELPDLMEHEYKLPE